MCTHVADGVFIWDWNIKLRHLWAKPAVMDGGVVLRKLLIALEHLLRCCYSGKFAAASANFVI